MERLKANKTRLWELVRDYTEGTPYEVEKRSACRFWKAYRRPDYYLEWMTDEGPCRAGLVPVMGRVLLSVDVDRGYWDRVMLKRISMNDLRRRGMVVVLTTAAEGKRERGNCHE